MIFERKVDRYRLYAEAAQKWGFKSQLVATCEELAELIVEVAKQFNGKRKDLTKLIDEMADAKIMMEQIECNYDIFDYVELRKIEKLRRLHNLITQEGNSHPVK